jgi:hypothetical protein
LRYRNPVLWNAIAAMYYHVGSVHRFTAGKTALEA